MSAVLARAAAWLNTRIRLGAQPRWPLGCGCPDEAHRHVCGCGRSTCEQHRNDLHDCVSRGVSP